MKRFLLVSKQGDKKEVLGMEFANFNSAASQARKMTSDDSEVIYIVEIVGKCYADTKISAKDLFGGKDNSSVLETYGFDRL